MDLRQAMARLGDTDQLRFFRHRLLGGDRTRAIDALDRSIYIARSELAEAVGTFLSDTTPLPGGGHGRDTPARWAIDTLAKTYPEIAKSCPRNNRAQFWRTQLDELREDAAAEGPTHDPRPGNIDRDPAPINTAPGNTGPPPDSMTSDAKGSRPDVSGSDQGTYAMTAAALFFLMLAVVALWVIVRSRFAR
ncbi:MAG: hypothetical protein IT440_06250 [Phycisphaeraceae bacterium]|nr:hypothetical protein [Phycisphaeraceae bacterium]